MLLLSAQFLKLRSKPASLFCLCMNFVPFPNIPSNLWCNPRDGSYQSTCLRGNILIYTSCLKLWSLRSERRRAGFFASLVGFSMRAFRRRLFTLPLGVIGRLFCDCGSSWMRSLQFLFTYHISRRTTKPTISPVCPAKLRSACTSSMARVLVYPLSIAWRQQKAHVISEYSDQTARMRKLIWVFAGRTSFIVGFVMRWLLLYLVI